MTTPGSQIVPAQIPNKDIRRLAQLAHQQGWRIEQGNGHTKWYPPDPSMPMVTVSTTPNVRGVNNTEADLKRSGLITNRAKLREMRRGKKTAELVESVWTTSDIRWFFGEQLKDFPEMKTLVDQAPEWAIEELRRLVIVEAEKPQYQKDALGQGSPAVMPNTISVPCRLCGWGTGGQDSLASLVTHVIKRHTEDEVKRSLVERPPNRERLDCPECPSWFWVSEPGKLDEHLEKVHKLARCGSCGKIMKPGSLQVHLDAHCPSLHPRPAIRRTRKKVAPDLEFAPPPVEAVAVPPQDVQAPENMVPANAPPPPPPLPVVAPPVRPEPVVQPDLAPGEEPTDDELWALMELVLDGPMVVNRESLAAVNAWLEATKVLLKVKRNTTT